MKHAISFTDVTTQGLEASPFARQLAGVRANEARYYKNKFDHDFITDSDGGDENTLEYIKRILKEERDLEFAATPLETSQFQIGDMLHDYVFYDSGLSINVMYSLTDPKKRAVGFKLCEDMEVPSELSEKFKFARQKSKLAGVIRGSFFVIKKEYTHK